MVLHEKRLLSEENVTNTEEFPWKYINIIGGYPSSYTETGRRQVTSQYIHTLLNGGEMCAERTVHLHAVYRGVLRRRIVWAVYRGVHRRPIVRAVYRGVLRRPIVRAVYRGVLRRPIVRAVYRGVLRRPIVWTLV